MSTRSRMTATYSGRQWAALLIELDRRGAVATAAAIRALLPRHALTPRNGPGWHQLAVTKSVHNQLAKSVSDLSGEWLTAEHMNR